MIESSRSFLFTEYARTGCGTFKDQGTDPKAWDALPVSDSNKMILNMTLTRGSFRTNSRHIRIFEISSNTLRRTRRLVGGNLRSFMMMIDLLRWLASRSRNVSVLVEIVNCRSTNDSVNSKLFEPSFILSCFSTAIHLLHTLLSTLKYSLGCTTIAILAYICPFLCIGLATSSGSGTLK